MVDKPLHRLTAVEVEAVLAAEMRIPSIRIFLFVTGVLLLAAMAASQTTLHVLAGYVPYTQWDCNGNASKLCTDYTLGETREQNPDIYHKTAICNNSMKAGMDFVWNVKRRHYYSVEWGLYCDDASIKGTIAEVYFIGGIAGTFVGGPIYDQIGRRNGALIGMVISLTATFFSTCSPTPYHLAFLRFLQGFGMHFYYAALYVYIIEISPPRFRVFVHSYFMIMWPAGILLTTVLFRAVQNWVMLLGIQGVLLTVSALPVIFGPDSPRFILVNLKRREEARKCLEFLLMMNGDGYSFTDNMTLLSFTAEREEDISGWRLFKLHPQFVKQVLLQMTIWALGSYLYYVWWYSWTEHSHDVISSSIYSSCVELVAYTIAVPLLLLFGRKLTILFFFVASGAMFVLMMFPIGGSEGSDYHEPEIEFTIVRLIEMIGSMMSSAAFSSAYLYTFELAPTTHRGRIFGACQVCARLGSYLGTKTVTLLESNKQVALILFAIFAFFSSLVITQLPDTRNKATPNVPAEIEWATRVTPRRNSTICNIEQEENGQRSTPL